jgi:hypothetical protein
MSPPTLLGYMNRAFKTLRPATGSGRAVCVLPLKCFGAAKWGFRVLKTGFGVFDDNALKTCDRFVISYATPLLTLPLPLHAR